MYSGFTEGKLLDKMNKPLKTAKVKDKESAKKVKTARAKTAPSPDKFQSLFAGPKPKTADTIGKLGHAAVLNKKQGATAIVNSNAVNESVLAKHLERSAQKVKQQAAAEIMSYLEKLDVPKFQPKPMHTAKLPYNMENEVKSNDDFHTPSFRNNDGFSIGRPTTAGIPTPTVRREAATTKGTKKTVATTKLHSLAPNNLNLYASKSEILINSITTPPNSVDEKSFSGPKGRKKLRNSPSYDNLVHKEMDKIVYAGSQRIPGNAKRPKSTARGPETKTVMPVRALKKSSSVQVMVPQNLKQAKAKQFETKHPTKTKMTLNLRTDPAEPDINNNSAPLFESKTPGKGFDSSTAKAIRSALLALSLQEEKNMARKSRSSENNLSSQDLINVKGASKPKKAGTKVKAKKNAKSKTKPAFQSASKEQFFEYQNKKVDEQFTHVYERQLQLETEVRSLIDALELEQAIRGSASHGISSSPCCCSAEIRGKLKSLLQKQKQLIRLQIDLRKRYGVGPSSWENQADSDMPILNGYNMPFERFASYAREKNGKMIYHCDTCNVSSETELLFRLHLESPQHVVQGYKDIYNALPVYKCEGCDAELKGTTKYMNHVTSDDAHVHSVKRTNSGNLKKNKPSRSHEELTPRSMFVQ